MSKCQECGLPIEACNALASYRKAIDYYKRGRAVEAERYAESAKEFFESYMIAHRR